MTPYLLVKETVGRVKWPSLAENLAAPRLLRDTADMDLLKNE